MIHKIKFIIAAFFITTQVIGQDINPAKQFWNALLSHCGNAYEGTLALPKENKDFGGKKLMMHVRSCNDSMIKIPFFVGEDKSRTWILTYKNDRISLQHDHRHKDGSEDKINFYGGTTTNVGKAVVQFFPADAHTQRMIPAAATNVWWITINDTTFTYNLRRLGTDRVFKVVMDLQKPIATPDAPWGWKEEVNTVLKKSMDTTNRLVNHLTAATSSIEARKDYQNIQFKDSTGETTLSALNVVAQLNELKQKALQSQASKLPVPKASLQQVLETLTMVIQSNTTMSTLGQLNTNRTIEPTVALAQNKVLKTVRDDIVDLLHTQNKEKN
ncbi:hypothetical protein [Aquimarina sp. AU474]|uniref:hypothetical protein n=1 Tax=Aquimarina sp. AU474 TaxID=2108529 RepID=UPI00190F2AF2